MITNIRIFAPSTNNLQDIMMMIIRRALTVAVLLSGIMAAHAVSTIQRKQLLNDGWWFV